MKELAAAGASIRVPVAVSCRVLKLHRQHYYAWLSCPVADAECDEAYLANAIFDAHRGDPEFGYRLLFDQVRAAGHDVSERTVWKICSINQWWCALGKKRRGRKGLPGAPAHEDLVRRNFTAPGPNRLWLADITEHPTAEGKIYICAVKDVWSNRIVGYSIAERMTSQLAVDALESALARRGGTVAGCTLHTDRGGQFRSRKLQQSLWRHQMLGSMGQVGSAGDNAAMESFFSLLQPQRPRPPTLAHPRRPSHRDRHLDRTHLPPPSTTSWGRLTPIEFEAIMTQTANQAA